MIVSRNRVFGAKVRKRQKQHARCLKNLAFVTFSRGVRENGIDQKSSANKNKHDCQDGPDNRIGQKRPTPKLKFSHYEIPIMSINNSFTGQRIYKQNQMEIGGRSIWQGGPGRVGNPWSAFHCGNATVETRLKPKIMLGASCECSEALWPWR